MKDKSEVIRRLIERTQRDFMSYYDRTPHEQKAKQLMSYALRMNYALVTFENDLNQMLPDTEDDGRWQASYALNTGCMMLNLVDLMKGGSTHAYDEPVTLFFDTIDFKVQEALEKVGIEQPSEEQIASHDLMLGERQWFSKLLTE